MVDKLDHVAIAVRSIEEALPLYRDRLGLELVGEEEVPSQHLKVAVLLSGGTRIELLEPISSESPVFKYLEENGEGLHHIAFGVAGIEKELDRLAAAGIRLVDRSPRPGAEGARIAFLHPRATGKVLIELVER